MISFKNLTKILALIFFVTPYSFQTLLAAKTLPTGSMTQSQMRSLKKVQIGALKPSDKLQQALEVNHIYTLRELSQLFNRKLQFSEDIKKLKVQIVSSLNEILARKDLQLIDEDNLEKVEDAAFLSLYEEALDHFNETEKDTYRELLIKYQQTLEQASSSYFDILSQHSDELAGLQIRGINIKDIISHGDIDELDLPVIVYNGFITKKIYRISQLCELSEHEISLHRVNREKVLQSIKEALSEVGLRLRPPSWHELIELGLPEIVIRLLRKNGIYSSFQLNTCTEKYLLEIRNLGPTHLNEIKKALQTKNLTLKQK